ncbi:MAG TPA: hypothetical protein PLA17_05440 [Bacteroidales bacterium]|nr:hypothetical protein [Bacteroidales bacterium]HMT66190.1 hypothetical protein [Bacteroidales bacterium]HPK84891.1 hypothetical protein [Bacteroidales bacterium]
MTNQTDQHLEDIQAIRRLMESSSRFLSLSGLSGIITGVLGIAGALGAQLIITRICAPVDWYARPFAEGPDGIREFLPLFVMMAVILILAFSVAAFLSTRKARKSGIKAWTPVTRRMLVSLLIPLGTGGLFILLTAATVPAGVIVASTLIFYGLALISAGKFTFGEIHWLGVLEVAAGLFCLALPQYSVLIWVLGFGLLHIVYGLFMHLRYRG